MLLCSLLLGLIQNDEQNRVRVTASELITNQAKSHILKKIMEFIALNFFVETKL